MTTPLLDREEVLRYAIIGGIPPRLLRDALLLTERKPAAWRVVRRYRWHRALKRVARWAGWQ